MKVNLGKWYLFLKRIGKILCALTVLYGLSMLFHPGSKPVALSIAALGGALYAYMQNYRRIRWRKAINVLLCLAAVCFAAVEMLILFPPIKTLTSAPDYIVVLGAAIKDEHTPSRKLAARLDKAAQLYRMWPTVKIVVSGGVDDGRAVSEAAVMAAYLEQQGVARTAIIEEDRSQSTYENFVFSMRVAPELKEGSTVFVSNHFHIYRAGIIARRLGLEATGASAPNVDYSSPYLYYREAFAVVKTWLWDKPQTSICE